MYYNKPKIFTKNNTYYHHPNYLVLCSSFFFIAETNQKSFCSQEYELKMDEW